MWEVTKFKNFVAKTRRSAQVRPHLAAELPVPQAVDERAEEARQHIGEQVAAKEQRGNEAWLPLHQPPVDQW